MRNSILAKQAGKRTDHRAFPTFAGNDGSFRIAHTESLKSTLYTTYTCQMRGMFLLFSFVISFTSTMISWSTASLLMISAGILKMITGAKWTASILHLEETPSDPVSCVLKSSLDAPEKLAMLANFIRWKDLDRRVLLLLKQICRRN